MFSLIGSQSSTGLEYSDKDEAEMTGGLRTRTSNTARINPDIVDTATTAACGLDRLDELTVSVGPARLTPVRSTQISIMVGRFMTLVDDIIVSASGGFDGVALAIRDRVTQFRQEFRASAQIETFA